jgi:hypothetical protein
MKHKYIKDNVEYLNHFNFQNITDNETKVVKALEIALDTRKFEIELYWKRATYFWTFIAASITAFFVLLTSDNINNYKHFTIIISLIGYLFSLGWHLVNKGSKYWQENWERHVSNLEGTVIGPLFAYTKIPERNSLLHPIKGYPFSVSKINQLLSLFVIFLWFGLFVYSLLFSYDRLDYIKEKMTFESTFLIILSWLLLIITLTFIYFFVTRSFVVKGISELTDKQSKSWLFVKLAKSDEKSEATSINETL